MTADEEIAISSLPSTTASLSKDEEVYDEREAETQAFLPSQIENAQKDELVDLEAKYRPTSNQPLEYTVGRTRKLVFLLAYFILNLGLTISNKAILHQASFPWMLTAIHSSATSIGCAALHGAGYFSVSKFSKLEHLVVVAFSSLFTLNIAVSNISLSLVSVPFHQVLRSTCPLATICIYRVVFQRKYAHQTYLTMVPLITGVSIATFGDYYFTLYGFILTILGVLLAAIKTVTTNRLMTGKLKLSPLESLFRMSPLATIQCLICAYATGEMTEMREAAAVFTPSLWVLLGTNALVALSLNMVSFQTNKVAGALTISVCGNLKQCVTILFGIVLFNVKVTTLNGIGMAIALAGGAWYSKVELDMKRPV